MVVSLMCIPGCDQATAHRSYDVRHANAVRVCL